MQRIANGIYTHRGVCILKNKDGWTADKRCKWHYCSQKGQKTKETCPACDIFYELKEATSWED